MVLCSVMVTALAACKLIEWVADLGMWPRCKLEACDRIPELACEVCRASGSQHGRGVEAAGPDTRCLRSIDHGFRKAEQQDKQHMPKTGAERSPSRPTQETRKMNMLL